MSSVAHAVSRAVRQRSRYCLKSTRQVPQSFASRYQARYSSVLFKPNRTVSPHYPSVRTNALPGQISRFHRSPRTAIPVRIFSSSVSGLTQVEVRDGTVKVGGSEIPNIWLRDNCQCSACVHQDTKQRLLDTFSIPRDIAIKSSEVDDSATKVEWSDGHLSQYDNGMLRRANSPFSERSIVRQGLSFPRFWGAQIQNDPPSVDYHHIIDSHTQSDGIKSLLERIRQFGFCFIDKVPFDSAEPTKQLLEEIAFIRLTHYGGFYDFTADLASKDTAYTSIALDAHTDNTYFSDPAGLQAFHLLSHTDGEGGASLLVDGFKAAEGLLRQDPEAYEILASVNVHAHASGNDGISIQPYRGFPVLEHDVTTGDLLRVRWNSSDRAGIELHVSETAKWYDAARKFDALLKKKENEYWEQLTPGRVVIFDNWRVMHGRSAFTGKRRICGAYINRDDWISRYKVAKLGQDEVLKNLPVS